MSAGEEKGNGFRESREEIVKDTIERAAAPQEHPADVPPAASALAPRLEPRLEAREPPTHRGCARAAEAHGGDPATRSSFAGLKLKRSAERNGARSSRSGAAGGTEPVPSMHPAFRTEVAIAGVTVRGVLPGTARLPVGSIAVSGDVHRLSCDQALELVDALLLVVTRLDVVAEERYSVTTNATCGRAD